MSTSIPQVDKELYPQLLEHKAQELRQLFAPLNPPELEVFASPPSNYRYRAEFRLWHEGDDLFYVMFEIGADPKKDRRLVRMDTYPVASATINRLMPLLLDAIRNLPVLRQRLFQVEFLTGLSGEALITLIYHRQLDEAWEVAARELAQSLGVKIIGRARKQKRVLTDDFILEEHHINGRNLIYKQVEGSFTQPNPFINMIMLQWALDVTTPQTQPPVEDLVEFYCGNGNFSVALAPNFRQVLGTEISRTSVAAANFNIEANKVENLRIERLAAEDFARILESPNSPAAQDLNLNEYEFSTVLVDPPRAGLDAATLQQVQQFDKIVYISCNPLTLHANLEQLCQTHRLERLAFFDQFPYTHHAECGVYLVRK